MDGALFASVLYLFYMRRERPEQRRRLDPRMAAVIIFASSCGAICVDGRIFEFKKGSPDEEKALTLLEDAVDTEAADSALPSPDTDSGAIEQTEQETERGYHSDDFTTYELSVEELTQFPEKDNTSGRRALNGAPLAHTDNVIWTTFEEKPEVRAAYMDMIENAEWTVDSNYAELVVDDGQEGEVIVAFQIASKGTGWDIEYKKGDHKTWSPLVYTSTLEPTYDTDEVLMDRTKRTVLAEAMEYDRYSQFFED